MTLEKLQQDMIAAIKEKDKDKKEVLSSLIGAIKNEAINKKCRNSIPEELVNEVILKELKIANEMKENCPADREDLRAIYSYNHSIISNYAPKLLNNKEEIYNLLIENGIEPIKANRGKAMKFLKGKADLEFVNKCGLFN